MPPSPTERIDREAVQLRNLESAVRALVDKKLSRRARDTHGGAHAYRQSQWGRVHNALRRLDKLRASAAGIEREEK